MNQYKGKVYSGGIVVADITGKNATELKRKASRICNNYDNYIDGLVVHVYNDTEMVDGITFARVNKKSPNNEIIRGKWD